MASIMKRGNTYSVRYNYKDHAGKPCKGWETFKTKAEAQERKITVEKELLDGTFLVPDTMTVEEMLYKWIPIQSSKHKWSPKTYTQSVAMVQNLIVPYIGKRKVQDLRTYDIEQFYATLSQTPCGQYVHGEKQELTENQKKRLLSSTSIHEVHTLLKTAFSYAVDWDLIHKSPTPREAPKINTEERTIWDERTMLAALQTIENPALHLAVHLSMILSLREGEILGLQPGDLDFDAADGRGTITVNKAMQRADKVALSKIDPSQIYHIFPDQREGSSSALVLKKPKTKKSSRTLYLTRPLKEELLAWLEKLRQDELAMDGRYRNCGQLFRLPNGMPVAPEALSKWYRTWRAEHPEFEKIVFHGLRHSSATYQLIESGGNIKAVQGNTGHATTGILMDTYAHTQDKPRLELAEKLEADFYSQDIGSLKSGSAPVKENLPDSIQITPEGMLKVVRQMNPEQRREFTRLLFA
ncbi:MAG: tyrosine recombinase XerC [Faecalibacterium sp.]